MRCSNWESFEWDDPAAAYYDQRGGTYAIYGDGVLVYIGESDNLASRFRNHSIRFGYGGGIATPWGSFRRLTVKVRKSRRFGDWAMLERRLIRRLKPVANIKGTGRKRRSAADA